MDNEFNDSQSQTIPQDKADLLARIHRERSALAQAISRLSEKEMTAPGPEGWSIKDHLAHIVVWEQILVIHHLQARSFAEAARMDEATAKAAEQMDVETDLNDFFRRRDQDRPPAEVLSDFQQSHQQVLAFLEDLPFANLLKPRFPDDPDATPLIDWVMGNTYEHYQEHRLIIEALAQQLH